MLMFLTIMVISFPIVVLACVALLKTSPSDRPAEEAHPAAEAKESVPRFFVEAQPAANRLGRYPVEALLSQLERHVRLEQAAAEGFLDLPTKESLHSRTASPFVN